LTRSNIASVHLSPPARSDGLTNSEHALLPNSGFTEFGSKMS
jgi:hypothetical protein